MGGITIDISNAPQIVGKLQLVQNILMNEVSKILHANSETIFVKKASERLEKQIEGYSPVITPPVRTGALNDSITTKVIKPRGIRVEERIGSFGTTYAHFVEKGTGPRAGHGRIVAKNKSGFMYFRDGDGNWYVAKEVRGMPPRPFITPTAVEDSDRYADEVISDIFSLLRFV